ncbi:Stk1 family PASTA domain-containing Ser/Thr kinase [Acidothermaceae bacterium B102]|nr:Stk1 family PASTA domain-containing Ser/Thr kinase [Acidothermaceae bacterium B102]
MLGYGGMAEVLRGRDVRLGRDVAVKILRPDLARDPAFQARFRREAQSAASLNHPAIVAVYDTGEDAQDGVTTPYIVMEYVEGRTLREVLQTEGALMPVRALEIAAGVCSALQYSHAAGIIHRDIKPANVMLTPSGAIKVMDFGIARAVTAAAATMTQTAAVIGTAQYLSPEQARGEVVDARSDIYSTGCLLYELLTGRPPFVGDSPVSVAYQHVREDAAPPSTLVPDIEPSVDAIVMKALAKNPANRYQTAAEMQADITRALAGRPVLATPVLMMEARTQVMAAPVADVMSVRPARREHHFLRGFAYLLLFGAVAAMVFGGVYELHKSFGPTTPKTVAVPDLSGKNQAAALADLKQFGLVGQVMTGNSGKKKGTVYNQSPVPQAAARPSSTVTFYVSLGAAKVVVPDVRNQQVESAQAALHTAGFAPGQIKLKDGTTKGQVISSSPAGGTTAATGTPITLVVGSGMTPVPSVIGLQFTDAQTAMTNAGLSVLRTNAFRSAPANTVTFQNPKPSKVALGTVVQLTVSLGPAPKPVVTTAPPTTAPVTSVPPAGGATPPPAGTTTPPAAATTTPPAAATTTAPAVPPPAPVS